MKKNKTLNLVYLSLKNLSVSLQQNMQIKQSEYEFAKNLLQLFKQRSKQIPHIDHNFESIVLSSQLKNEYLQISDRIGLTKKDTANNLAELIHFAKETGKYGFKVHYLQDTNTSIQERLRSFLIDLNKYLKELSETSANTWSFFKKIKNNTFSVRNQKQHINLGAGFYLNRLKQFKQEVENNKYYVIKADSHSKVENLNNRLQEIKVKILSIYHSLNNDTPFILKKKELRDYQIDAVLDEILKKLNDKTQFKAKQFYINCFVKVLQCRKIYELKQIQKDICYATKKNDQLILKRALKLYIQHEIQREKQTLVTSQSNPSLTPLRSNQNIINLGLSQTQNLKQIKQPSSSQVLIKQLKKQVTYLKQIIKKNHQKQTNYQSQISILSSQLQNQSMKFGFFDRSDIPYLEQEDQLIPYESAQETAIYSLQINLENDFNKNGCLESSIIEQQSMVTSKKVDKLMHCIRDFEQLEIMLNKQIRQLASQNNQLNTQIYSYQDQITLYKNRVEREKQEKQRYKYQVQELLVRLKQSQTKSELFQSQIEMQAQNLMNEKQTYLQKIQNLSLENDALSDKIHELKHLNSTLEDKVEQLQKAIERLNIDLSELVDEIKIKAKSEEKYEIERKQLRSSLQNYRDQLKNSTCRSKQLRDFVLKLRVGQINQVQERIGTEQQLISTCSQTRKDIYSKPKHWKSQWQNDFQK